MTAVEYVRDVCKQKKIPVSKLEEELQFANGYLNPKKCSKIEYSRALAIAEYLNIPAENILALNIPPDELVSHAQNYLNKTDSEMAALLREKGIAFDSNSYQDIKTGAYIPNGLRDAVREICRSENLSGILMRRLGFGKDTSADSEGLTDIQAEAVDFIRGLSDEELRRFMKLARAMFSD